MSDSNTIYLDYAAATPIDPAVKSAMEPYLSDRFYNPSSAYQAARRVKSDIAAARENIASWFGVRSSQILFTAGDTESCNIAIHGVLQQFTNAHIVVAAIEHDAVLAPSLNYPHSFVKPDAHGSISAKDIEKYITDNTALISIGYANNEIGTVQHLSDVAEVVQEIRNKRSKDGNVMPLFLHTDAAQAAQYLDLHRSKIKYDLLSLSAAKIYGPKQVGLLVNATGITLAPFIAGGGQEKGVRSGTLNVAGIIGLSTALKLVQSDRHQETRRIAELRDTLQYEITKVLDDKITVLGHKKHRLPNSLAVMAKGIDGERAMMMLDELGVMCSTGAACSALTESSSHVMMALGFTNEEARGLLRFSLGRQTDEQSIKKAAKAICDVLSALAKGSFSV